MSRLIFRSAKAPRDDLPLVGMDPADAAFWNGRAKASFDAARRRNDRRVRAMFADCERRPLSLDRECC